MFDSYVMLKVLHILLITTWLGTDFGTFFAFRRMKDPSLSLDTRKAMGRLFAFLDMGPRSSLVLMLTLGIALTHMGRWGFSGGSGQALAIAATVLAVLWVAAMWHQFWVEHPREGEIRSPAHVRFQELFRPTDIGLRLGISGGLAIAAIISLAGEGPIEADWLSWKLVAFAGIVLAGVGIRITLPPVIAAITAIYANGSTPEREAALQSSTQRTTMFVYVIWVLIILNTWLAVAKI